MTHIRRGVVRSRLIGALFLIVGIAVVAFGIIRVREALASKSWPSTTGTILVSKAEREMSDGTAQGSQDRGWEVHVEYEYEVDGQRYESDRVGFAGLRSENFNIASALASRYKVGSEVTVYYNPDRPDRALLEPGTAWAAFILPAFGVVLVIGATLAVIRPDLFGDPTADSEENGSE